MKLLSRNASRTVDATNEPVSLEEAKQTIGIAECTTTHDSRLKKLIKAARIKVEKDCRRAFIKQTWVVTLDDFPSGFPHGNEYLELPRPPLLSSQTTATTVVYEGSTGSVTWSSTNYSVDANREPGAILVGQNITFPSPESIINAVTITSIHGYSTDSDGVPEDAKLAILSLVDDYFCAGGVDGPANTDKYDSLISTLRWGDYR